MNFKLTNVSQKNLDPKIDILFDLFKRQFDKDDKKYQKRVNANRRIAKNRKNKRQNNEWSPMESNGKVGYQKLPMVTDKGKGKDKDKDKDNTLDIIMKNPRRFAKNEIQNTGKKEDLIDLWENNFSDAWKQDSKIKGMYENKLSEFED